MNNESEVYNHRKILIREVVNGIIPNTKIAYNHSITLSRNQEILYITEIPIPEHFNSNKKLKIFIKNILLQLKKFPSELIIVIEGYVNEFDNFFAHTKKHNDDNMNPKDFCDILYFSQIPQNSHFPNEELFLHQEIYRQPNPSKFHKENWVTKFIQINHQKLWAINFKKPFGDASLTHDILYDYQREHLNIFAFYEGETTHYKINIGTLECESQILRIKEDYRASNYCSYEILATPSGEYYRYESRKRYFGFQSQMVIHLKRYDLHANKWIDIWKNIPHGTKIINVNSNDYFCYHEPKIRLRHIRSENE